MRQTVFAICCWLLAASQPSIAPAADRTALGFGDLLNNDAIGDGQDRWRSASYVASRLYGVPGPAWDQRPAHLGELLEVRVRVEAITAANSATPAAGDRRFAGILGLGLHSHATIEAVEVSAGGDLMLVGPMTQVGTLQGELHSLFGIARPDLSNQLPDAVHPTLTVEAARPFRIGGAMRLRPFVEGTAGLETLVRVGGDLSFGAASQNLMVRDSATGQLYRAGRGGGALGFSFTLGADVAHVFDSNLLPGSDGYVLVDQRSRVRAGVRWQGARASAFYGLTWMSEEFQAQPEAQAVGSLQLSLRF